MVKVVGVRFKDAGKMYYFDPCDAPVKKGDAVVVETSRGSECGSREGCYSIFSKQRSFGKDKNRVILKNDIR